MFDRHINNSDKPPMKKRRAALILTLITVVSCIIAGVFIIISWNTLTDAELVRSFIGDNRFVSAILLISLSAFQVIIAIVPSEAVELAAGYLFNAWEGALYCLAGTVIGSIVAILLTRRFGRRLIDALYPLEKLEALPVFSDKKKRNVLTALLFLIPGTPKDLLTYVIGLTDMSIPLYLLLTTVSRFPSVIISTTGTDLWAMGNYSVAIIVLAISVMTGIIGTILYKLIISGKRKKSGSKPLENPEVSETTNDKVEEKTDN